MEKKQYTDEIFTIEDFFSHKECQSLIERGEESGFTIAPIRYTTGSVVNQEVRNNESVKIDDPVLASVLWERLSPMVDEYGLYQTHSLNPNMSLYKYSPGQKFAYHRDGKVTLDDGIRSFFTVLVYLNENLVGGNTVFRDGSLTIKPKTGMLLCFRQKLIHKGNIVKEGLKYVWRSDVMFKKQDIFKNKN